MIREILKQTFITCILAGCFIRLFSQPCKIENPPSEFPWSYKNCPSYLQVGKSQWIPEVLKVYQANLASSQLITTPILRLLSDNIVLVKYTYNFDFVDYKTQHEFYYLIEKTNNLLLWQCRTFEYPHGSLEKIRPIQVVGKIILEFEFFTGGTAGYWEEYFEFKNSKLYRIKESYVKEADFLIPKGYSIRRVQANVENLTASIYLAKSDDANCCPSGRLDIELTLLDQVLHFKSGRFLENK